MVISGDPCRPGSRILPPAVNNLERKIGTNKRALSCPLGYRMTFSAPEHLNKTANTSDISDTFLVARLISQM